MDNGPMWSQDEIGHYWLLFPNKHAHTKEEIREIFSQFGKVTNVTAAGDEKGFRFVQFSALEDVERAVESLKTHPTIKLVPHRPKNKNSQNSNSTSKDGQNNNASRKSQTTNDNTKRNFYQRKPLRNDNVTSSNESRTEHQSHVITSNEAVTLQTKKADYGWNNDNTSVCSSNASDSKTYFTGQNSPKSNLFNQTSPVKSIGVTSPRISVSPADRAQILLKLRGTTVNAFSPPGSGNDVNNTINSAYEDEIPDLVIKKVGAPKKIILNAEEVVVANIHNDYGSAYILHLFEQFEPLAVSYIKVLPKTETRYCHVYFKTVQDSIEVETQFDKHNLAGKKLVVLRPCRLMEEARI